MSWESDVFVCNHCGKEFPKDPVKLALHIRNSHETVRSSISNIS